MKKRWHEMREGTSKYLLDPLWDTTGCPLIYGYFLSKGVVGPRTYGGTLLGYQSNQLYRPECEAT